MVWEAGLPGISRSNPTLQAGVRIESQPVQAQQPAQYYMPPQPVQYQPQPMQFQPPQQPYTSIGLGGGGTQGQNALPLWGLAQGGNTQSGWQLGGSTGGGQLFGTYLLGGGGSTDTYIEPWMPQERAAQIRQTGMSTIGMEVQALKKQIDAEKNNYARQALTAQYNNAMTRWQKEWENQIPAYRDLAMSGLRQQAQDAVARNTAIGEPTNLNAMWGNSVLSNNNVQIGIIQQGRMIAPRGNALEDALAAGLDPNSSLAQFLADQDVFAQDDYMPGAKPSLMSGYNSMGLGGGTYTGNADAFAYGGDGSQYARQESWNILRDHAWQQQANERYIQSINNRMPVGDRKGTGNGITNTGVSGRVVGYTPSGSSGPAENTGYGPNGEELPWKESPLMKKLGWAEDWMGDNLEYDRESGQFLPSDKKPEKIDPINDGYIRELNWRGQVDSQANQMRSQGVPEYQVQEFIKRMNKPNGMLQLPPMSAYPAAMGIAEAPPITQRGSMSPNNDVFADQFTPAPSRGDATHWPYGMRTQSNSFDRYAFNPMLAGAVDARMNRK